MMCGGQPIPLEHFQVCGSIMLWWCFVFWRDVKDSTEKTDGDKSWINLLEAAADLRLGVKVHLPAGQPDALWDRLGQS